MRKFFLLLLVASTFFSLLSLPSSILSKELHRVDYERNGRAFWDVRLNNHYVALTFDDGPHKTYTKQILEILKENHIKATFFTIGDNMVKLPNLTKRIVHDGHEIGNHTMSHVYLDEAHQSVLKREVSSSEKVIKKFQPFDPKLFRPPGGVLNEESYQKITDAGYQIIMWSWNQDPKDWQEPSASKIANHVITNVHSGDIILLHDGGGNRKNTVKAIKTIIPTLKEQGYQFVKVSELIQLVPYQL